MHAAFKAKTKIDMSLTMFLSLRPWWVVPQTNRESPIHLKTLALRSRFLTHCCAPVTINGRYLPLHLPQRDEAWPSGPYEVAHGPA